jgi:transposase
MSKTTNKFSPEVKARAVRMVQDQAADYPTRWLAVVSIAKKIGCAPQTLHEWVKRVEVDRGVRLGISSEMAEKMTRRAAKPRHGSARTESCARPMRFCAKPAHILRRRSSTARFANDRVYR